MPIEILMPALSPTMTEGTVAKWLKKEGEKVSPGEVIAEIETDKAVMEVEAVDAGIMGKIVVSAGTTNVKVHSLIAVLLEKGESKDDVDKITERYASKRVDSHTEKNLNSQLENLALEINIEQAIDTPLHLSKQRTLASPLARRIASQNKVSLDSLKGPKSSPPLS